MKINVFYFGYIRERITHRRSEELDIPDDTTMRGLFETLCANYPGLDKLTAHMRIALNENLSCPEERLSNGDEVALIPPVAGGSDRYCRVTDEELDLNEIVDAVSGPSRGGIVTFIGKVRDNSDGKKVTAIEYEAYRSMAISSLSDIITRCEAVAEDVRVAVAHRTGTLDVGETVVIIAAAGPHRAEAFQAARSCAELMKWETTIWRKEIRPDGEEWIGAPCDLDIPA